MSKDRFNIKLKCPMKNEMQSRRRRGMGLAKGNKDTYISDLPNRFKIVDHKSRMASVDIFCLDCNVSAIA